MGIGKRGLETVINLKGAMMDFLLKQIFASLGIDPAMFEKMANEALSDIVKMKATVDLFVNDTTAHFNGVDNRLAIIEHKIFKLEEILVEILTVVRDSLSGVAEIRYRMPGAGEYE